MGILSRSMDPEAGKWTEPIALNPDGEVQELWQNPTGKPVAITRCMVHVITGVADITVDIGTSATVATSDLLIDAGAVGTSATIIDNLVDNGTDGKYIQISPANGYVTADLSAAATGLVAYAYIQYKELTSA